MLTFQYRLYPDNDQQSKLWKHANKLNNLYNYFLNQRIENFKIGIKITQREQQLEITQLKKSDFLLQEIHSQSLQQVPLRLDRAYKHFYKQNKIKKGSGFPKFRSCKNFFSICYPQAGYSVRDNFFITKAYGKIQFVKHRELKGNIKQVSISNKNDRWFLNISTDYEKINDKPKGKIGIDVGLKKLYVDNEGNSLDNCTHAKYFDKQISKLQSRRSSTKKGSRKNRRYKRVIQKLYDAKNRKINDFQHKVSKNLSRKYDTIFAENLSVKHMSEGNYTRLNRSIRNAKLAQFLSFLSYKVNHLILVNPKNTSKTCNKCGKVHEIKLSDRRISCSCGNEYDRDENAAKNVYCLGQAILEKGYTLENTINDLFSKGSSCL